MTGCFTYLLVVAGGVLVIASVIRWFEQTAEAVDHRWWHKLLLLVLVPPSVWLFPSKIAAGRPGGVPRHSPVIGFGGLPKSRPAAEDGAHRSGTGEDLHGPPRNAGKRSQRTVDPEQLAKLREKLRQQMHDDPSDDADQ